MEFKATLDRHVC